LEGIVLFIHIVVCVLLVIIVLLQSGKSADLAGAFGGAGSQSTFGPRGTATFLSKMTTTLAILFMVTSLTLWLIASKKTDNKGSVSQDELNKTKQTEQTVPATTSKDEGKQDAAADKAVDKEVKTKEEGKEESKKEETKKEDAKKTEDKTGESK
jgi:preprotein translocase subunit SecG